MDPYTILCPRSYSLLFGTLQSILHSLLRTRGYRPRPSSEPRNNLLSRFMLAARRPLTTPLFGTPRLNRGFGDVQWGPLLTVVATGCARAQAENDRENAKSPEKSKSDQKNEKSTCPEKSKSDQKNEKSRHVQK